MILCFEVGGARIRAGVAVGGRVDPLGEVPTPGEYPDFVAALRGHARAGVRGVALSVPGGVDPVSGRSRIANIPYLDGRRVALDLSAALGLPVVAVNDADCFALAEARWGAGRGHDTVFGIILGSGVGGGLVIGGQLVTGAGGFAGEWGHGPVISDPALPCGCGLVGCVETVGGARGIERLHLVSSGQRRTSEEIVAGWLAGETAAQATVARWLVLVAGPLAMVVNVVGAGIVPVGGGLGRVAPLITALDGAVRSRMLRGGDAPLLVQPGISVDAGLLGAAAAGVVAFGG